jgi:hypothetical protein
LTLDGADEYQRNAFGAVLIASIVVCLVLSLVVLILSTECLRDRTVKLCRSKNGKGKTLNSSKVAPAGKRDPPAIEEAAAKAWE